MSSARPGSTKCGGRAGWHTCLAAGCGLLLVLAEGTTSAASLTFHEAVQRALLENRQLQIERIDPDLARSSLDAAFSAYDPVFTSRLARDSATDTGGFDPTDFSRDAIYSADSELLTFGLTARMPTGTLLTLGGNYAHSSGTRNFFNFDSYKAGGGIGLEQPLLRDAWIDQPRWQIQVSRRNLKMTELGVHFLANSVVALTQQAYYQLAYTWENLAVQRDLLSTRQDLLRSIRRQVELGVLSDLEEKTAQAQAAATETDLLEASNAVVLASNQLRTLMGTGLEAWDDAPLQTEPLLATPETLDRTESWRAAFSQRSDLKQLALNLESAELTVRYRRNQLLPTLNLFGGYGLKGSHTVQALPPLEPDASWSWAWQEIEDRRAPSHTVGVLFSLPLTRTAERANYRASRDQQRQAELLLKQKEELVMREIADALALARSGLSRCQSSRQATDYAREALAAEQRKLVLGTGATGFVLQSQTDLARARANELMARRDYNIAVAQLRLAEGTLLERARFELTFR